MPETQTDCYLPKTQRPSSFLRELSSKRFQSYVDAWSEMEQGSLRRFGVCEKADNDHLVIFMSTVLPSLHASFSPDIVCPRFRCRLVWRRRRFCHFASRVRRP
jgi:hypothetical protein